MKEIKVFISCPSDLDNLANELIEHTKILNDAYRNSGVRFQAEYWTMAKYIECMPEKSPQEIIDRILGGYDVFFGMMKNKYGTELNELGGKSPTEYEYTKAMSLKLNSVGVLKPSIISFAFLIFDSQDQDEENKINSFRDSVREHGNCPSSFNEQQIRELYQENLIKAKDIVPIRYIEPEEYRYSLYLRNEDTEGFLYTRYKPYVLSSLIDTNKKILILGAGGSGKSTLIKYTAWKLYSIKSEKQCIMINSKRYTGGNIEDILPEGCWSIPGNAVLMFDSLDEMKEDPQDYFINEAERFMERRPDVTIIVTSRFIPTVALPIFEKFSTFYMMELSETQIVEFMEQSNVSITRGEINNLIQDLPMVQIPFYLNRVIDYYDKKGSLPQTKYDILEYYIEKGIEHDTKHFQGVMPLVDKHKYLINTLIRLSTAMTHNCIDRLEYDQLQSLDIDSDYKLLIKGFTILISSDGKYLNFTHKIIKDYLTSKWLSKQVYEDIVTEVYDDENKILKSNWIAPLIFVMETNLISGDFTLIDCIIDTNVDIILEMNPTILPDSYRKLIFTNIFEKYSAKSGLLDRRVVNTDKLADFWIGDEKEHYLLDFIKKTSTPMNMLYDAFNCLYHSPNFLTNKANVDRTLTEILLTEKYRDVWGGLVSIGMYKLDYNDNIKLVIDYYIENGLSELAARLVGRLDKKLDYMSFMVTMLKDDESGVVHDMSLMLAKEEYWGFISTQAQIEAFIDYLARENTNTDHIVDKAFEIVINRAIELHPYNPIIWEVFFAFGAKKLMRLHEDNKIKYLTKYFLATNSDLKFINYCEKAGVEDHLIRYFVFQTYTDDILYLRLYEYLLSGQISISIEDIIHSLETNWLNFGLAQFLISKGYKINLSEYNKNEKKAAKFEEDMGLFFEIGIIFTEVCKFFGLKQSIKRSDIRSMLYHSPTQYSILVGSYLSELCINDKAITLEEVALMYEKHLDWIRKLYINEYINHRKSDEKNNLYSYSIEFELSFEIKEWLQNWSNEYLAKNASNLRRKQIDANTMSADKNLDWILGLFENRLIYIEEEYRLLYLSYVFYYKEFEMLTLDINKRIVDSQVKQNLRDLSQLFFSAISNHLQYCLKHNLKLAVEHCYYILEKLSVEFFNDYHLRMYSIEILANLENDETALSKCISTIDTSLLNEIADVFIKIERRNDVLNNRLENTLSDDLDGQNLRTAYQLCYMDSQKGLEYLIHYISIQKEYNRRHDSKNPFLAFGTTGQADNLFRLVTFSLENDIISSGHNDLIKDLLDSLLRLASLGTNQFTLVKEKLSDFEKCYNANEAIYQVSLCLSILEKQVYPIVVDQVSLNEVFRTITY